MGLIGKIALCLVVALAAIGGFIILQPDDTTPPSQTERAATAKRSTTAEQSASKQSSEDGRESKVSKSKSAGDTRSRVAVPIVRFRNGKPVGGAVTLSFRRGDQIHFEVMGDKRVEAHLHGYDIEREVRPGRRAVFNTEANIEGRFELELHDTGALIATVQVTPR